jgi:hypothetical protein
MRIPTVHLNGTSSDALTTQVREAQQALRIALEALQEAAPHGRDYYVQEGAATKEAIQEHTSRLSRVKSVLDEMSEIREGIETQKLARKAR